MTTSSPTGQYLPGRHDRARLMRIDSAAILKRFFFCEEALICGQAGWLAAIAPLDLKLLLPRHIWEDALVADSLRQRVLELRYPSKLMEIGDDAPVVSLFEGARHAPSAVAYVTGLAHVLLPALTRAYRAYLDIADDLGDGPTKRFMAIGLHEKERQIAELAAQIEAMGAPIMDEQRSARAWTDELAARLDSVGGLGLEAPRAVGGVGPLRGTLPFTLAQSPARDPRFYNCRFYWPDNIDPSYSYGEGLSLQMRSAVSHLNEVWAVETAGAILETFAEPLGWEFVADAARWVYDEARHTMMGWTRLRDWGFTNDELPLGTYIYDSARNQDPIYRMGMLHYFEAKNIGKKTKRAAAFASYGDAASQHDMDFDWADEGMHASYGHHWLTTLLAQRGEPAEAIDDIRDQCAHLVAATVAQATPEEQASIRAVVGRLIAHAETLAVVG